MDVNFINLVFLKRRRAVVHSVMRSIVFLKHGSRTTAGRSLPIIRSLLSALGTGHEAYINVTTGVVNSLGHVVIIRASQNSRVLVGPIVRGGASPFPTRRNYLSLINAQGAAQCQGVRIFCRSHHFHGRHRAFAN